VATATYVTSSQTNRLTPRSKVLLEKLMAPQLAKNFPAFCKTCKFVTPFTTACHLSLYLSRWIQSTLSTLFL